MANVLGLALKITADATGLKLDPVQRALVNLGTEADKLTGQFAKFAGGSEAAARAQDQFQQRAQDLINTLRDGGPGAALQFASAFEKLTAEVNAEAAAFERAARITEANLTQFQRFERTQAELNEQVSAGRITQETYNRAIEAAAKGLTDAERSAAGLSVQTDDIAEAGENAGLKFNELSGIFAVLPGPLGDIAGRISGVASAGEGLSRVFQGGLSAGLSGIATQLTSLINPFTIAAAGITALGAAATAVVNGLAQLDDRVENLGNKAAQLGVSFGFIQTLEEAAIRSGTSIDAVSAAFTKLQVNITGVDEESKKAQAGLASIGVTAEELKALSPEQQYELIGDKLAEIEDPAKRSATAIQLFGKSGAELLPFFNNLEGAAVDIQRFNGAISDIDRARVDGLGASFDAVRISLSGFGVELLTPFIGITQSISDGLASLIASFGRTIGNVLDTLSPVSSVIGLVVNVFAQFTSAVANAIGLGLEPFAAAGRTVAQAIDAISQAVTAGFGFLNDSINGIRNGLAQFAQDWLGISVQIEEPVQPTIDTTGIEDAEEISKDLQQAIDGVTDRLNQAIEESAAFGQAGFDAALSYQNALKELQRQFDAGILNETAYKAAIDDATESYEAQIDAIKSVQEEAERRAQAEQAAAQKIIDDNRKIADSLLEQLRIEQEFNGDSGRAKAAENVRAVTEEIARVERELAAARAAGDDAAAQAAASRLAKLDQALAREQDIASGAAAARADAEKAQEEAAREQERIDSEQAKRDQEIANKKKQAQDEIFAAQQSYNDRLYEVERERIEELNSLRLGAVDITDIRNGSAGLFLDLAAGREDPAIAEYRAQLKELKALRADIQKLQTQKAEILGGIG